jgi:hypothetical protein
LTPDGPRRRQWTGRHSGFTGAGGLAASGAVLLWFGVNDLFGNTDYGVRLRAGLMVTAGLYVLVGATTLALLLLLRNGRGNAVTGGLMLTSAVVTGGAGALLTLYQAIAGDYTPWLLVWLGMVVTGMLSVAYLLPRGARPPYPRQFAAAVTITTLLAIGNFAYTNLYQPGAEPAQFDVEVAIGKPSIPQGKGFASVPITVSFQNTGKTGLTLIMSTYSVVGRKARFRTSDKTQAALNLDIQNSRATSRRLVVDGYDVLQSDKVVFEGTEFEPGDRAEANRTVEIPFPTTYDSLALNAWVLVLRGDDVRLRTDISRATAYSWNPDVATGQHIREAPDWAAAPGIDWALHEVPIEETSYLRTQTRRAWTGYVWLVASDPAPGRPPGSYLSYHFTPLGHPEADKPTADQENETATDRYGVLRSATGLLERSVYELGLAG